MGRDELSGRDKWQDHANESAQKAADAVFQILHDHLKDDDSYRVEKEPGDARGIYEGQWGIIPDIGITYLPGQRRIFIEAKRQQGAGNAHERAGKYFAPGIVYRLREICNIANALPVFFVFMDGISSTPKYRAQIQTWFSVPHDPDLAKHFLLWEDRKKEHLVDFFENGIRPLLEQH